jgi:c-di-GMP-binding flagellar brake protein YcgR
MSDLTSFSIQNPKQISSHLLLLFKHKCLLSAHFGKNDESYITTLLGINEENNALVLDYGPKEYLNHHILNASEITFETEYRGIKVSFAGDALKKITYKGEPAFSMPLPKSFSWRERRDYYRVKSPFSKSSYCQLIAEDREPINLKLYDISLTGFALLNGSKEASDLLRPGASFTRCNLMLSETGNCIISFEVSYEYLTNPDKLHKTQKVGCKFKNLSRSAEDTIQSYMQKTQREDLQKDIHLH